MRRAALTIGAVLFAVFSALLSCQHIGVPGRLRQEPAPTPTPTATMAPTATATYTATPIPTTIPTPSCETTTATEGETEWKVGKLLIAKPDLSEGMSITGEVGGVHYGGAKWVFGPECEPGTWRQPPALASWSTELTTYIVGIGWAVEDTFIYREAILEEEKIEPGGIKKITLQAEPRRIKTYSAGEWNGEKVAWVADLEVFLEGRTGYGKLYSLLFLHPREVQPSWNAPPIPMPETSRLPTPTPTPEPTTWESQGKFEIKVELFGLSTGDKVIIRVGLPEVMGVDTSLMSPKGCEEMAESAMLKFLDVSIELQPGMVRLNTEAGEVFSVRLPEGEVLTITQSGAGREINTIAIWSSPEGVVCFAPLG